MDGLNFISWIFGAAVLLGVVVLVAVARERSRR
jgi:hypothetical protein